jgi:hypothetical protein
LGQIFQGLFGGSTQKQKSESGNTAYPWLQDNFGDTSASAYNGGLGQVMGILGMGGGDPQALQKYWNSSGGQFQLDQGTDAINSNFAARGLGQSGAAMKALEGYRSNLASTKLDDIINNFLGVSKVGLGGADLIANAGQYSKGTSTGSSDTGNAGSTLGALLAFI